MRFKPHWISRYDGLTWGRSRRLQQIHNGSEVLGRMMRPIFARWPQTRPALCVLCPGSGLRPPLARLEKTAAPEPRKLIWALIPGTYVNLVPVHLKLVPSTQAASRGKRGGPRFAHASEGGVHRERTSRPQWQSLKLTLLHQGVMDASAWAGSPAVSASARPAKHPPALAYCGQHPFRSAARHELSQAFHLPQCSIALPPTSPGGCGRWYHLAFVSISGRARAPQQERPPEAKREPLDSAPLHATAPPPLKWTQPARLRLCCQKTRSRPPLQHPYLLCRAPQILDTPCWLMLPISPHLPLLYPAPAAHPPLPCNLFHFPVLPASAPLCACSPVPYRGASCSLRNNQPLVIYAAGALRRRLQSPARLRCLPLNAVHLLTLASVTAAGPWRGGPPPPTERCSCRGRGASPVAVPVGASCLTLWPARYAVGGTCCLLCSHHRSLACSLALNTHAASSPVCRRNCLA